LQVKHKQEVRVLFLLFSFFSLFDILNNSNKLVTERCRKMKKIGEILKLIKNRLNEKIE